jgi:hypothetical protein
MIFATINRYSLHCSSSHSIKLTNHCTNPYIAIGIVNPLLFGNSEALFFSVLAKNKAKLHVWSPNVYFRFQTGPLRLKCLMLVPYVTDVSISSSFPSNFELTLSETTTWHPQSYLCVPLAMWTF